MGIALSKTSNDIKTSLNDIFCESSSSFECVSCDFISHTFKRVVYFEVRKCHKIESKCCLTSFCFIEMKNRLGLENGWFLLCTTYWFTRFDVKWILAVCVYAYFNSGNMRPWQITAEIQMVIVCWNKTLLGIPASRALFCIEWKNVVRSAFSFGHIFASFDLMEIIYA